MWLANCVPTIRDVCYQTVRICRCRHPTTQTARRELDARGRNTNQKTKWPWRPPPGDGFESDVFNAGEQKEKSQTTQNSAAIRYSDTCPRRVPRNQKAKAYRRRECANSPSPNGVWRCNIYGMNVFFVSFLIICICLLSHLLSFLNIPKVTFLFIPAVNLS